MLCRRFVEEWFGQKKNAEISELNEKIEELNELLRIAQEEITMLKTPGGAPAPRHHAFPCRLRAFRARFCRHASTEETEIVCTDPDGGD